LTMQLMGTPNLAAIKPEMVNTDNLGAHISMVPPDMLQRETCVAPAPCLSRSFLFPS
jgi:hypothetical protein